jgi:transketolase
MYEDLIVKAQELRRQTFDAFVEHGEAHLGGSFSIIEILLTLYEEVLQDQDKFILSKAHASFPLCILLRWKGFHPRLTTHLELDSENGIHCTTGSLGHGLPIATGMAMARKRLGLTGRIYIMISDGECQEGTTWESLLIGAKHELDNLVVLVDYNKIQALTTLNEALPLESLSAKFNAFNWECEEVMDGHSYDQLVPALLKPSKLSKPRVVIAHTVKGKGIRAFENDPAWHARKVKGEDLQIGRRELGLI